MVLVSVVMTSYNHQDYIAEAISSVLDQTIANLELIIVDDASADNSRAIIEEFAKKDNRIKASFHHRNMGIPQTANDCLNQVTGKFISFIGSDDLWAPTKLEKQLKILSLNEDHMVWSEAIVIDSEGKPTGKMVTQLLSTPKRSGYLFEQLLQDQVVFFQSLIFKTDFIRNLRRDTKLKYVSDHRFLATLSKDHEFYFISEPLAKYRTHSSNITSKDPKGWARDRILIRKFFLQKYSNLMSARTAANLYYQIGHAYSMLGEHVTARYYYMRAFAVDHDHKVSSLYLILALTANNKRMDEFDSKYRYILPSFLSDLLNRRRWALGL